MTAVKQLPTYECLRCGHSWIPRAQGLPVRCARCKSIQWNKPRAEKAHLTAKEQRTMEDLLRIMRHGNPELFKAIYHTIAAALSDLKQRGGEET